MASPMIFFFFSFSAQRLFLAHIRDLHQRFRSYRDRRLAKAPGYIFGHFCSGYRGGAPIALLQNSST